METTTISALALIPDGEQWPTIQALRVANDKQVHKWPPHLNIFYPFLPEQDFEQAAAALSRELAVLGPLRIRFCSLGSFGGTVFLKPDCEEDPGLAKLHAACKAAFPHIPEKHDTFTPHLTIGQFKGARNAEAFVQKQAAISIETQISCVSLLARDSMKIPFRTPFRVMLGEGGVVERGDATPYSFDTPWRWTLCQCLPACTGEAAEGIGGLTRTFSGAACKLLRSVSAGLGGGEGAMKLDEAETTAAPCEVQTADLKLEGLRSSWVCDACVTPNDPGNSQCLGCGAVVTAKRGASQIHAGMETHALSGATHADPVKTLCLSDAYLDERFAESRSGSCEFFTEFRFLDPHVCQAIAGMQAELRQIDPSIYMDQACAPDNIHFTMNEIQLRSVQDVHRVVELLEEVASSLVPLASSTIDLRGVGTFDGRVLYVKPAENDALVSLRAAFDCMQDALKASGFRPRDRGRFVAHATVCKSQRGKQFSDSFLSAVRQKGYETSNLGSQRLLEVHFCINRRKDRQDEMKPPVLWRFQLGGRDDAESKSVERANVDVTEKAERLATRW